MDYGDNDFALDMLEGCHTKTGLKIFVIVIPKYEMELCSCLAC